MSTMRGIFAVDPGGTTGVAWGLFDSRADTVAKAMSEGFNKGSASIHHGRVEKGDVMNIVRLHMADIAGLWDSFHAEAMYYKMKHGLAGIDFVAEHFVLTPGQHKPGVEGVVPAYLLGAMFIEFHDQDIILQMASEGMRWHTRDFHNKYDTWIVGKPHEREAFAHVAARMHRIIR